MVEEQGVEARDKVLEKLLGLTEVPVPESVVEEQTEQHFTSQGHSEGDDHDTEEHRGEIRQQTEDAFRNEIVLDIVAEREEVGVEQNEIIEYIVATAQQYGMEPNQFAQMLDQAGQVPMIMGEVRRRKALAKVLELAKVTDSEGNEVDLSEFVNPPSDDDDAEAAEEAAEAEVSATEDAEEAGQTEGAEAEESEKK